MEVGGTLPLPTDPSSFQLLALAGTLPSKKFCKAQRPIALNPFQLPEGFSVVAFEAHAFGANGWGEFRKNINLYNQQKGQTGGGLLV